MFFGRSWKCIKSICVLLLVLQLPTCQLTNREIIYLPYIHVITVSEKDENFSFSKLILPRFWVYYGQTARSFDQKDNFLSLKVFEWLIDLIAKKSNTKRETFNRILQNSRSVKEKKILSNVRGKKTFWLKKWLHRFFKWKKMDETSFNVNFFVLLMKCFVGLA
jgi:hypothetical protein